MHEVLNLYIGQKNLIQIEVKQIKEHLVFKFELLFSILNIVNFYKTKFPDYQ